MSLYNDTTIFNYILHVITIIYTLSIGTFDVQSVTIAHPVDVIEGQLCLSVRYIEGHEPYPHCFVAIRSITTGEELSTTVDNVMVSVCSA